VSEIYSKSLEQAIDETHSLEEANILDKFKDLWKKTPEKTGHTDPTQGSDTPNDGKSGEKAVKDLADKLNIELVKGKYPHPGETALKDPEVIKLMTIFAKEALKGTTKGGTNIESLKKMMQDDPTSTINMMLYHVSVKARPFQRTGLDPQTPISLFTGIDDDKKDNFGARIKQSLKSRKKQGVPDTAIEKVVMSILKDLEGQLKANGFVVKEVLGFDLEEAKKGTKKRKQRDTRQRHSKARKARLAREKEKRKKEKKARKISRSPEPIEVAPEPIEEPAPLSTGEGGITPPKKGTIEVGRALSGKILKSKVLGNFEDPEEKKEVQKQIVKIITQLARPWFKKHIGARGQLKNIKLKEELELFEHTLSNLLFQEGLTINNLSGEKLAGFIGDINKFYPYAQEYLKFDRPTSLNLISDPSNSKDTFGKTAYYNPGNDQITIFVDKRHPKDMLRSFSHELVHHAQNCRGEFDEGFVAGENYIETDDHLKEMEREAYEKGNMCLRTYESYLKKEN
tara:strand:- start:159 stop:1691 length:1533 start_codon:yes stop_codon:yes gene_type:complete